VKGNLLLCGKSTHGCLKTKDWSYLKLLVIDEVTLKLRKFHNFCTRQSALWIVKKAEMGTSSNTFSQQQKRWTVWWQEGRFGVNRKRGSWNKHSIAVFTFTSAAYLTAVSITLCSTEWLNNSEWWIEKGMQGIGRGRGWGTLSAFVSKD
jgi:hypothetical protein